MNHVIEELKSIPGVMGSCIFHAQKGILANNLPSLLKEHKIIEMGKMLTKIYQTGRKNFPDIAELSLYYEEATVLIRESSNQVYLIILCDSSININLLSMSMNMVMSDLEKLAGDVSLESLSADKAESKPQTPEELLKSSPMAKSLNGIQSALAKVMGPMSKIIFMEALEEWLRTNTPSYSSLKNLIRILEVEIEDSKKISYYAKLIAPFLEGKD